MDLKPEQMPDAMREKDAGNAPLQSLLPRQLGQSDLAHEIAQDAVRRQVHLAIIAPCDNFLTQLELRVVQRMNEVGIQAWRCGVGACDIRRIATKLRPGIYQKRAQGLWWAPIEMLVMQYRRVLVIGHDIVVGHLLFALHASLQILHMGLVFGRPAPKGGERCQVAAGAQRAGTAQALKLVVGFDRPIVVQASE